MNILLISQCDKRALSETRRILDQFAERRGDRTWQTPITEAGLITLRRLLRRTARKNTAVACHWIRGRDHSELLWIVGDARRFNSEGAVPTNATARNVLRREDENDWHTAEDIRLLAQLAGLLHDLGKASVAFQQRLRQQRTEKNLCRHEWVSLRLFQAFVGTDDDEHWLARLADVASIDEQAWIGAGRYQRDGLDAVDRHPFRRLPPLAAALGWLVVTHHRLPMIPVRGDDGKQARLGRRSTRFPREWLHQPLAQVAQDWNEVQSQAGSDELEPYWQPQGHLPVIEPKWRAQAAKLARRLLERRCQGGIDWLANPYVMHLARLSLMLADHHYSSLPADSSQRISGDGRTKLYANTDADGRLKQPLDEHLLGVCRDAGLIAHALPGFEQHLPRLANHRGLRKRSADPRFAWQDKAADAALALREASVEHGAFIVDMASTGCGKTLANARILYALADPQQGMRATFALGLRTLTMQTGKSYRQDLHLSEDELAIRVGGSASHALFEFYEQQAERHGSASIQDLLDEDSHVYYEGNIADHPLLARALADPDIRKLLSAPLLVCTVDHLVPATESLRGGRQIAPMLRLMSSDLVLDELDDYDLNDLPALTRLVYWAGLLGGRVLLSSATLPPSLVEGMFLAYRAGRSQFGQNRGRAGAVNPGSVAVPCLWADEFGVHTARCGDGAELLRQHQFFVDRRADGLQRAPALRRGELLPLAIKPGPQVQVRAEFAKQLREACVSLHEAHAERDPHSDKRVSFGMVRMANVDALFDVAQALFNLGAPAGCRIHLCIYHARFPLLHRSAIEQQLDTTFNRRGNVKAVYSLPVVRTEIDAHEEADQLFIVLASPLCEVGRDWDLDWAVAEPSSMRSLIQLAGRIQRHRRLQGERPNMMIFDTNLRRFNGELGGDGQPGAIFIRPGFEKKGAATAPFRLLSQRLGKLTEPHEYRVLTALPRIRPLPEDQWRPKHRLVDLEHARMAASMLPRERLSAAMLPAAGVDMERDEASFGWQFPQVALTGMLPQQQQFRDDEMPSETLVLLPEDEGGELVLHRVEQVPSFRGRELYIPVQASLRHNIELQPGPGIGVWGEFDLLALLGEQADFLDISLRACAQRLTIVEVRRNTQGWRYHPWLGFDLNRES